MAKKWCSCPECECPPDHTITKLGHCRSCPYYGKEEPPNKDKQIELFGTQCLIDAHPHDFSWATYSDAEMTSGVCNCGLHEIDYSMVVGP